MIDFERSRFNQLQGVINERWWSRLWDARPQLVPESLEANAHTESICVTTERTLHSQSENLAGVMNAHAQRASELFLQGTGLGYFVGDNAGYEMPAGWAEMLSTMAAAFGEVVEHAAKFDKWPTRRRTFPPSSAIPLMGTLSFFKRTKPRVGDNDSCSLA